MVREMWKWEIVHRFLMDKRQEKRPLETPRHVRVDNINPAKVESMVSSE